MLALIGVLFLLPLLLIISIDIYIFDGRPVFFKQERVGLNGKSFFLYKFRSMKGDRNSEKGTFDAGSRKRVTKIGSILRQTKIDELPQLFNVVRGNMLIVGPRPEIRKWVEAYPERWRNIHSIHPGITDPASIIYRNEENILSQAEDAEKTYRNEILPQKLDLYEQYLANRSLTGDIKIIFKTFSAILH